MNIDFLFAPIIKNNLLITLAYLVGGFIVRMLFTTIIKTLVSQTDDKDDKRESMTEIRAKTIGSLIENVVGIVIWGIVFTIVLSQWGVNVAPILAGAGVLGLAVGFGAQTLVKDVVNGFFILLENQFNVGDTIEVAGLKGKVKELRMRTTVLKGKDGQTHIIPNSKIDKVTRD